MTTVSADEVLHQNEEYRRLAEKHQTYESRLEELQGKMFLTEEEKLEEVNIKKHKLQIKDRMESIVRQVKEGNGTSS